MTKAELRRTYLAKRKALTADERQQESLKIADNFFGNFDLLTVRNLHCFIPIEKFYEVDTMPIFRRLWSEFPDVRTFAPRVDVATGVMHSAAFSGDTVLARSGWGIHEPHSDSVADDQEIDLVLIPGVCFDRGMHRVGYGKGFYDRFLRNCRPDCLKIGLSFFEPVDEIEDVHAGDVRLDHCVTPECVFAAIN